MTALYINWNVSPEIFSIGSFSVRWYGLLFALSFFFGYLIMMRIFRKEGIPIRVLDALTTYMIIGTLVGARLGHCLFYEPGYYLHHPLKILMIWEGGLASHGAAIGIILAMAIFAYVKKLPFLWVIDRIVIVVALSGLLIRLGNLMNSEIYGIPTTLPWGFRFLRSATPAEGLVPRHPTQLYEGLSYLAVFLYLLWYYYRKNGKPEPGFLFGMFLVLVFGVRFLLEFLKEPQVGFEKSMALNLGQLLSIPFILAGIVIVLWARGLIWKAH
ncbi:MAG TPA: prolipoprotein diacylglyceryl transferase [Bacteroidales bacterium]|nr:prolipoprotein diacylglyceryl transferase [Bacteroidales bacterium]